MKVRAIVLLTEYGGEIVDASINDEGKVIVGKNEFDVSNVKPMLLKNTKGRLFKRTSIKPHFLMKTSTILPMMLKSDEKKIKFNKNCPKCGNIVATYPAVKKTIVPLDDKTYKTKLTPSMLRDMGDLRFLKQMKKYSEPKKMEFDRSIISRILMGIAVAIGVLYVITSMGIIKF